VETDGSGNLLQYMVYEPYGKIRHNYKAGSYGNDYTFTGKELDSETSLQYFGARYYSGIAGRFTSADPIFLSLGSGNLNGLRDPQAWNSYAYGRNNPYRMVDPDGQAFWDVVRTLSRASDAALNFVTFGAGDAAREMGQTGVTAGGVAQVVVGVAAGTIVTSLTAVESGAALGGAAIQLGLVSTGAQVAVQERAILTEAAATSTNSPAASSPNFIVTPGGTSYPVPTGASGPTPVVNSSGVTTGSAFTNGAGGANGQVGTMRLMDPNRRYPQGYIKYENSAQPKPQGVNPYTGETVSHPEAHHPID